MSSTREKMLALANKRLNIQRSPASTESPAADGSTPRTMPSANATSPATGAAFAAAPVPELTFSAPRPRLPPALDSKPGLPATATFAPSLKGDTDGLAEARAFMESATPGGHKSRPTSRGRATPSKPSSTPSSRSSAIKRTEYTHITSSRPAAPHSTAFHGSPSLAIARPVPSNEQSCSWSNFADPVSRGGQQPQPKASLPLRNNTPAITDSLANSEQAGPFFSPIDTSKTKILPPHLRKKSASAGNEREKGASDTAAMENVTPVIVKQEPLEVKLTVDEENGPIFKTTPQNKNSPQASQPTANVKKEDLAIENGIIIESNEQHTIPEDNGKMSRYEGKGKKPALGTKPVVYEVGTTITGPEMERLEARLAHLIDKVAYLESENKERKIEILDFKEREENRRYLGTSDPKTPFDIFVECPGRHICAVQVQTIHNVSEIIRRVRVRAKMASTETPNPRLIVDGEAVGHAMKVGECIRSGSAIRFTHDGAEEEEEDEEL